MKKVFLRSFGCQMNKLDTALVSSALKDAGFSLTDSVKSTDVVLINTCSVREHAEQRVFSHLGHLKHIKKTRPDIVVGVIGCMAQRLGAELLRHEAVDLVCGPAQIPHIVELLKKTLQTRQKNLAVTENIRQKTSEEQDLSIEKFESTYGIEDKQLPGQAFVRAMRGCNNFCTYCVVPYVRGPEVCRPPEAIIEQTKRLANRGVKQVTLLGQTINSYKYRAGEKIYSLADLLLMVSAVDGIEWIKFVTSYPYEEFFDDILQAMADSPKVCNYLHLPAQSGSDRILSAMKRRYTAHQYLDLINRARDIVPDIAIAGDFIVGFPGETDDDFEATAELVKKVKYRNCFIFKYSPRPGTKADKQFPDDVPYELKQKRNIALLQLQETISAQLNKAFMGSQVRVLVEGLSKKPRAYVSGDGDKPQLIGRMSTEHIVVFNGPESLAGEFAEVKIIQTSPLTLFGLYQSKVS
jgi:tRNA-2-methylthio-N6-dimethylallyladenosine synthase